MNKKERQSAADVEEARAKLLECFPGSFIRDSDDVGYEFIAHPRTNQSFILENCHYVEDIEAKVLELLSRAAFKTAPYSQEWRNRRFHEFILAGVNAFLDTDFSEEDMELIYTYMGNEIRHGLTMAFIDHDMSMKWLREHIPTERTSCTTLEVAGATAQHNNFWRYEICLQMLKRCSMSGRSLGTV